MAQVSMLSDEWLSRYRLLENFNTRMAIFEGVLDFNLQLHGNPGRFGPGSFRTESFRPGSFRPIFGVGRFGLGRWVVSANFLGESIRP